MSNPNNLIRPPVVNAQGNQAPFNMRDLEMEIRRMITEAVQEQVRNPDSARNQVIDQDQVIDPQHRGQLNDLDRVPDVVRSLREFTGQPGEYSSWRKSVERILDIYKHLRGTPKYFGILSVIRNKIVGSADAILESYNTPLNWESISRCLTLHYADKRDVSTLEYQLTSLVQGTETIQEFYQKVYNHLSLILNKISAMDIGQESLHLLTQTYRDKALDTFIRGLKGDLPRLLAMKEPTDLPKALHLCLKLENQNFRTSYAHNRKFTTIPTRNQPTFYPELAHIPPPPRPRQTIKQFQRQQPPHVLNYYQNQGAIPKYNQYNQNHHTNYTPPRPFIPKPQPRPEPMDVDHSMRTRNINYMNRPANNGLYGKRPPPPHTEARKQSRNFHLKLGSNNDLNIQETGEIDNYIDKIDLEDDIDGQKLNEYFDDQADYTRDHDQKYDSINEIHFLD